MTSDLESILESKDISKISDHIESMQNSLVMLQDDNGEYVNRCALLEDFKNKFETLMSADIISAFNSKSNGNFYYHHKQEYLNKKILFKKLLSVMLKYLVK